MSDITTKLVPVVAVIYSTGPEDYPVDHYRAMINGKPTILNESQIITKHGHYYVEVHTPAKEQPMSDAVRNNAQFFLQEDQPHAHK